VDVVAAALVVALGVVAVLVDVPDTDPLARRVQDGRFGVVVDTTPREIVVGGGDSEEDDTEYPWYQHDWNLRGGADVVGAADMNEDTCGVGAAAAGGGSRNVSAPSYGNRGDA